MPERPTRAPGSAPDGSCAPSAPPPDIADFIRFCHTRRAAGWPELYDEMCAVAARREFNGWGQEQLADRGLTFALTGMPQLAAWVRETLSVGQEQVELSLGASAGG